MGIEITFDDHLVKEQAHLDKKILILNCCHTEIFLKELSHDFGQKLEVSSFFFFFFNKISLEIKSYDHLVIKQAPPTPRPPQPKKMDFT